METVALLTLEIFAEAVLAVKTIMELISIGMSFGEAVSDATNVNKKLFVMGLYILASVSE
jgi:uncharacterized protein YoaH (UPF0181 family)